MSRGFLGTQATLVADINLVLQIAMWLLLVFGVVQAKRRQYRTHAALLTAVVGLGVVLFATVMDPAFFRALPFILQNPGAPRPLALWTHAVLGLAGELLGAYILIATQWGKAVKEGFTPRVRWAMRLCAVLWSGALAAGVWLYYLRYMQ